MTVVPNAAALDDAPRRIGFDCVTVTDAARNVDAPFRGTAYDTRRPPEIAGCRANRGWGAEPVSEPGHVAAGGGVQRYGRSCLAEGASSCTADAGRVLRVGFGFRPTKAMTHHGAPVTLARAIRGP